MSPGTTRTPRISVIIPAYNEQSRVAATVSAARAIVGVTEIMVVDDGSRDATAQEAARAGARVIRGAHRGKGAALRRGIAAASGDVMLLLDADLGASAINAAPLIEPVVAGRADLTIGVLPARSAAADDSAQGNERARARGGFGLALGAARVCLWLLTGRVLAAPLSGQRCMRTSLARTLPFTRGFGAEVAATTDAIAAGARVEEVAVDLSHAATGRTIAGFIHRGRQLGAILAACLPRLLYPLGPTARIAGGRRLVVALCGWMVFIALGMLLHPWLALAARIGALAVGAVVVSMAVNAVARIVRPNYQGRAIPAAGGLGFFLAPWAAAYSRSCSTYQETLLVLALAVTVIAAVGLADDLLGRRDVRGLAGHLGRLARGKITTGALKAIVGAAVGLTIGWLLDTGCVGLALLNALVIALTTNSVNLLDVRPGRAFKGFILLAVIAVAAERDALYAVVPIGAAALAFEPLDFGARAMMGDVGANSLGVVAGIALAAVLPLWGKLVLAAALVGIHLYSEFRAINDLIARTPALRWLDRLGRAEEGA
jgi:UDP-N-acetylmuramyl pentapeptide phosphotransferase/UDP-N-acetylglucosamine-1-phosphate transferase